MSHEGNFLVRWGHYQDLLHEAERERLIQEVIGDRGTKERFYHQALSRLRRHLSRGMGIWQRGVRIRQGGVVLRAITLLFRL